MLIASESWAGVNKQPGENSAEVPPDVQRCLAVCLAASVHANICQMMPISLVPAFLQHTKHADTTACQRVIQRDTRILILLSHWYQHIYNIRKMLILPFDNV
jgi:hypothetical protein